jgi:hypothetical protein
MAGPAVIDGARAERARLGAPVRGLRDILAGDGGY